MVREDGVSYLVNIGVDVLDLASPELVGVHLVKGRRLGFGGADILAGLVEIPFWSFNGVRVVFLDVLGSKEMPVYEVASLDSLEPGGFNRVATDGVHPFDGLFSGGEVVDTVGLAADSTSLF